MKATFSIYYEDLTEIAQYYLCRTFKTTPPEEHTSPPLVVIERELEKEIAEQPEKEEG